MSAPLLALCSAVSWGSADFLGGLKAKTSSVLWVVIVSQASGALIGGVALVVAGGGRPEGLTLLYGALAGCANAVGLIAFYRGLAVGRMSVVAPIAGLGVLVPIVAGLATGERPAAVQGIGMCFAATGVVLATRQRDAKPEARSFGPILLAIIAALGIGANLALLEHAVHGRSTESVLWAILCARVTVIVVIGIPTLMTHGARFRHTRSDLQALILVGAMDCFGNFLFGLAVRHSLLSLSAVLASLHPAVTVLLARAVLSERMRRVQQLGVLLAIFGATLLSAG